MMPAPADLASRFAAKGIGEGTRAILYSRGGMQWATRVWWMLRAIGFDEAAVLDGGFDKWSAEGRPVEAAEARYPAAKLIPAPRPGLFVGKEEVKAAIGDPGACTINALARDLHRGENPRYGRPGRIPGSVNVPASEMVDPASLTLKGARSGCRGLCRRRRGCVEADPALLRRRHRGDAGCLPPASARLSRHRRLRRFDE